MVERVKSRNKRRERILIKNSLVIKGNVVNGDTRAWRDSEENPFRFAVFSSMESSNPQLQLGSSRE